MTASELAFPQPTSEEMPTALGMADAGATCVLVPLWPSSMQSC